MGAGRSSRCNRQDGTATGCTNQIEQYRVQGPGNRRYHAAVCRYPVAEYLSVGRYRFVSEKCIESAFSSLSELFLPELNLVGCGFVYTDVYKGNGLRVKTFDSWLCRRDGTLLCKANIVITNILVD